VTDSSRIAVSRPLVGILALLCLGGGLVLLLWDTSTAPLGGTLLRVGVLLGALWLALPLRKSTTAAARFSPFVLVAVLAGLMLIVRRPAAIIPSLVLVAVLGLLLRPWRSWRGTSPDSQKPRLSEDHPAKK